MKPSAAFLPNTPFLPRALFLLSTLFLSACGAGVTAAPDGGSSTPDSGVVHNDAGTTHPDAGTTHPDAGTTHPDAGSEPDAGTGAPDAGSGQAIQTVFMILMENHNWSDIKGSSSAPYINSLLSQGAHAEQYYNPPGNHPSEPNYLWLEAGTNFGITADGVPSSDHQSTTAHLVTQLDNAGISWKSYQEDISGTVCPLTAVNNYAPKHDPMVYFDDITNTNSTSAPVCLAHVRPYTELASDLNGTMARYNFITPNLCDDMHTSCAPTSDEIVQGDTWLSKALPPILASNAYKHGGVVFLTWDESEGGDLPIGMIVLSSLAKTGYSNSIVYTHSSLLRTNQEIFGVQPFLGDAANAKDLSDLFTQFP